MREKTRLIAWAGIIAGIIIILLLAGVLIFVPQNNKTKTTAQTGTATTSTIPDVNMIYPTGSEMWTIGQTYTMKWSGGAPTVSIFLINKWAEQFGASVSSFDRIYNIPNRGIYDYTVPAHINTTHNEYQICIEDGPRSACSGYFSISK